MRTVNIHEAKTQFSRLVDAAAGGEEIIIAKAGKPAARLVPMERVKVTRRFGGLKGKIRIADAVAIVEQFRVERAQPARLQWLGVDQRRKENAGIHGPAF